MTTYVPDKTKFRTTTTLQFKTRRLFHETSYEQNDKSDIPYTLKDHDEEDFISLKRLYLEEEDPTEFVFANKYLFNYKHWQYLCEAEWFKPVVARWRNELELQIKAKALQRIIAIAEDSEHKSSYEATKLLLNAGWKQKDGRSGRKSKEEIKQQAQELHQLESDAKADLERILEADG